MKVYSILKVLKIKKSINGDKSDKYKRPLIFIFTEI